MMSVDMQKSAQVYYDRFDGRRGYALSVWSWPELSADEIAGRVGTQRLPHDVMRVSSVGALQAEFSVLATGDDGHLSVQLPSPPTEETWNNLRQVFGPPQPNPVARKRGSGQRD